MTAVPAVQHGGGPRSSGENVAISCWLTRDRHRRLHETPQAESARGQTASAGADHGCRALESAHPLGDCLRCGSRSPYPDRRSFHRYEADIGTRASTARQRRPASDARPVVATAVGIAAGSARSAPPASAAGPHPGAQHSALCVATSNQDSPSRSPMARYGASLSAHDRRQDGNPVETPGPARGPARRGRPRTARWPRRPHLGAGRRTGQPGPGRGTPASGRAAARRPRSEGPPNGRPLPNPRMPTRREPIAGRASSPAISKQLVQLAQNGPRPLDEPHPSRGQEPTRRLVRSNSRAPSSRSRRCTC